MSPWTKSSPTSTPATAPAPARTVVVPYYVNRKLWWTPPRPTLRKKRTPVAYAGRAAVHCKLDAELCAAYNGSAVRAAILAALPKLGGAAVAPSHFSGAPLKAGIKADVLESYRKAKFCMVPMGDVYSSKRLYSTIMALCLPIIASDRLPLPFASEVPWADFTLRISEEALLCDAAAAIGAAIKKVDATPGRLDAMQRALVRERGRFLFTDATEAPGAAERAAPAPPDETEREMHAMLIRQIEAQRNGADGSFLARDWLKEAGTRPARCEA